LIILAVAHGEFVGERSITPDGDWTHTFSAFLPRHTWHNFLSQFLTGVKYDGVGSTVWRFLGE
jgi:hypothetical protein